MVSKKKILIIVIVILFLLAILPIWCTTYYLPTPEQTAEAHRACGPIWTLFQVF